MTIPISPDKRRLFLLITLDIDLMSLFYLRRFESCNEAITQREVKSRFSLGLEDMLLLPNVNAVEDSRMYLVKQAE
jgi:hypothetical protein